MIFCGTNNFLYIHRNQRKHFSKGIFSGLFFDTFPFKGGEEPAEVSNILYPTASPSDTGCFVVNSKAAPHDLFFVLLFQGLTIIHLPMDKRAKRAPSVEAIKIFTSKMLSTATVVVVGLCEYLQRYELVSSANSSLSNPIVSPNSKNQPQRPENGQKNQKNQKKVNFRRRRG